MQDDQQRSNAGCLVFVLLAFPIFDAFGMVVSCLGADGRLVLALGAAGFLCGAALGAYLSARSEERSWRSSSRWAIYGFVGLWLPYLIFVLLNRQQ